MHIRSLAAATCTALLGLALPACVVRSDGGIVFARGTELAERHETLSLDLAAGEALDVYLLYGDIQVRVAPGVAPRVEAHWRAHAADQATAESVLARYRLELSRSNGALRVSAVGEPLEVDRGLLTSRLAATVDLAFVVPEDVRLSARSESGDVAARGRLAGCKLESSYGDLAASGIRGDLELRTASGDASVEDVAGGAIEASSSYGDISASDLRAERIRLSTASGSVRTRRVHGALAVQSSYGDLDLHSAGGDLDAVTSSGDITLASEGRARRKLVTSYGDIAVRGAAGELESRTSSGAIAIEDADGTVRAESTYGVVAVAGRLDAVDAVTRSGDVVVRAAPGSSTGAPWRVATGYGDARLVLPQSDFGCELDLTAQSGDVEVEGDSTRDGKARHRLGRTLGAGGGVLSISSASGDVRVGFR